MGTISTQQNLINNKGIIEWPQRITKTNGHSESLHPGAISFGSLGGYEIKVNGHNYMLTNWNFSRNEGTLQYFGNGNVLGNQEIVIRQGSIIEQRTIK